MEKLLGMTPPMGWNSWNTFTWEINEELIKQAADGQGETATAVVEKANELKMQIERLISALENTEDYISRTVAKYKRIDKEVTEAIINSTRTLGDEINGGN